MSIKLYAFECGRLEIPHGFLLEGAKGKITVPIPSYLIVHPKGRVLFDSGLNVATQTDSEAYITSAGMRFNKFHFTPGEEISARLEAVDVAPEDIDLVVNSHLHYDHAGGNALLPNADILVQGSNRHG
jgi:glyoxylase-like metal-dependent hydrolase (beta-lactamase superfamily II)